MGPELDTPLFMEASTLYELIGYAASVLVAVALTMRSVLRLRLINLVGSATFTVYGLLIHAYPVAVMNFAIVLINVYFLVDMLRAREYFELQEVPADSPYLQRFLAFYRDDIRRLIPDFDGDSAGHDVALLVLRNMVPAGVLLARKQGDDSLLVTLDYVIPGYRDLKAARFLFTQNAAYFTRQGIHRLLSRPGSEVHARYLRRVGFQAEASPALYVRAV